MFYMIWLLLVFVSCTEFDLKYPGYYKLEESNMSPSSILRKVVWDENSRVVFFFRCFVIVGVFLYFWYLQGWTTVDDSIIFKCCSVVWGLSYFICNLFRSRITNSAIILNRIRQLRTTGYRSIARMLLVEGKRSDFEITVNMIISPFNPNIWRNVKEVLYKECTGFARCVTEQFSNRILKLLALCSYYVLAVIICFVCVCIVLIYEVACVIGLLFMCLWYLLLLACVLEYRTNNFCSRLLIFCQGLSLLQCYLFCIRIAIWSIMSFLFGLFLNLFYFIPYFAFFSVLTFYCCTYWKTMEEQHSVLKRLIYEACRETQNINGCIPNRHPKPNEYVIPVVSKRLYDKIREELLPYDTNLFYFGLKMVWSIAFSYAIFTLINMLNEFNVTGLVQVITTASLGVMPHILNTIALKTNKERKKAKNEKLKLNVRYRVEELISKNVKLYNYLIKNAKNTTIYMENTEDSKPLKHIARTVLILEQEMRDNETRPDDASFLGLLKYVSGWYLLEIDDVENDQQAPPVMLEMNSVTTDDENTEDSEHFETMFGIDCFDNDETGSARTATLGGNHETTDENGQNSENAYDNVDSEDGQLDEIVHRNREALIDDDDGAGIKDSEEQPLIQQNNDVMVEGNHQNSGNAHDNVDGDDGRLAVIVHRNHETVIKDSDEQPLVQQNNDVIVEENHQNSGNAHDNVDGDDGRLAVIVHRNHETISDDIEDSEEQPLVQQNNDVIAEENHQNSGNAHDNVDGDDGKLAVIVHRNHETIIEDSEEKLLVQQNNDVIV